MRIAIDSATLSGGHAARGVGGYTKHLVDSLQKLHQKDIQIELLDTQNGSQLLKNFDVVHYPFFDFFYHTLPIHPSIASVVTIHDTIPLIYPEHYPAGVKGKLNLILQKRALRNVNHVITVSETSKKDIVRFLGVEADKVTPIYEGPTITDRSVTSKEITEVKKKYGIEEEYVLYIGDVNWNKNLLFLCEAIKKAKMNLVIVGKAAVNEHFDRNHIENKPLVTLLEKYGNDSSIKRLGYVEDLAPILKGALCLCQPSVYEGFGLNVLDAMSVQVPTVVSKIQVFKELYENAALFFDPYNIDDLVANLLKIQKDSKYRQELAKIGLKCASEFTWRKTAQQTLNIYIHASTH